MKDEDKKVGMLLDISNFYGEHSGRLGPLIKCLLIAAVPGLIWIYLAYPIPAVIFLPLWAIYTMWVVLLIIGRQPERMAQFKRQLNDEYTDTSDLVRIRAIHPDGCVEYTDGTVVYAVVAHNGTTYDATQRSQRIHDFLSLLGCYSLDTYIQNVTETKTLASRYQNVQLFVDSEAAQDFVDMIDYNSQIVYSQSLLTRTVFVVKGRKSSWTDIRDNCKIAIASASAKAFKSVCIAPPELIQDVLDTDIRGVVNLQRLLQEKYATHQYYGSKVLYYDEDKPEPVEEVTEERGFMITDD